ncbi:hypothetical protein BLS_008248 [Venturia inaequalis]|uniref:Uncharacterized protein n=1 Tax=Venturia inaequalis TaxID=5025 RepID=A0A8H3U7G8_VENIN|nr:hypothetical protein BLS_008248 [Venturia inaequalis]KAE9987818.1 hypothetical protein EG327_003642 [Venturia inaequalis]RDI85078.1 hypothetical protein Vi05172_g4923 [Venturia inaequalis]
MHFSTLFSNLLVATQLGSLPSLAHGRSVALLPASLAYSLEPRQTCATRHCGINVPVLAGQAAILEDEEMDGSLEFVLFRTNTGGVAMGITNGLGVQLLVRVAAFNGQFHQDQDVGAHGVTMTMTGAHWDIWHGNEIRIDVAYRYGLAKLSAKPHTAKPNKAGGKRDLLIDASAQGEAIENEKRDAPVKPQGSQPLHVDPKGHQATGINDKKPKGGGGGGGCPGGCTAGSWRTECRPRCT